MWRVRRSSERCSVLGEERGTRRGGSEARLERARGRGKERFERGGDRLERIGDGRKRRTQGGAIPGARETPRCALFDVRVGAFDDAEDRRERTIGTIVIARRGELAFERGTSIAEHGSAIAALW